MYEGFDWMASIGKLFLARMIKVAMQSEVFLAQKHTLLSKVRWVIAWSSRNQMCSIITALYNMLSDYFGEDRINGKHNRQPVETQNRKLDVSNSLAMILIIYLDLPNKAR